MRAAVDQFHGFLRPGFGHHRLDHRAQSGRDRQQAAQAGPGRAQPLRGAQEVGSDVADLAAAAAGHHGHHGLAVTEAERNPGRGARHVQRDRIGQRMAHIAGRHAGLLQQRRLEREEAQHVVGRRGQLVHPPAAPGPDRRADEVDGLEPGRLQAGLEAEVEVGRIDADEGGWTLRQQAIAELGAQRDELAVDLQRLGVAVHRKALAGPPRLEALGHHVGPADAGRLQRRPAGLQAAHQQAGEQVARGFASDHAELHGGAI